MSHFTVMIIGEDIEEQLAPFHEFECTGLDDEYVQDIEEDLEKLKNEYQKHKKDYPTLVEFLEEWHGKKSNTIPYSESQDEDFKYGYVLVDENGEVIKVINRTNKNAKWDWWVIGGRWSNKLLLKNGVKSDSALKKDIDVESMRLIAKEKSGKEYIEVSNILKKYPDTISWTKSKEKYKGNIDAARDFYHKQPGIIAFNNYNKDNEHKFGFFTEIIETVLTKTKEEYVYFAELDAISTFAMIKDKKWSEKGEMGWFACVSNPKDETEWAKQFNEEFDKLPDDALITIVDCHI